MLIIGIAASVTGSAWAHVSQQGLALLLPTGVYTLTGCLAVIISIVIVSTLPSNSAHTLFTPRYLKQPNLRSTFNSENIKTAASVTSLLLLISLIVIGTIGTRDPLANLLPLTVWTLWWSAIVAIHVVFGNIWNWINPWTGLYKLIASKHQSAEIFHLPKWIGCWPAVAFYLFFYLFIIADIAPDDPARLANVVLAYVLFTFMGMFVFGANTWLRQVECFSVLSCFLSQISPIKIDRKNQSIVFGLPGWKAMANQNHSMSHAVFLLTVLACGSFDGVNDTFWWLDLIGINPLAFPGRSAVVLWSAGGVLVANVILLLLFACCIWLGIKLARKYRAHPQSQLQHKTALSTLDFKQVFCQLSISVLPIAAAYHGSHYLISFLVNGQYFIAAVSDPLATGSNILGLENYQVTTGFLNTMSSVRRIWLTQASLVVVGHILAVLMAHHTIAKLCQSRSQAIMLHIPLACFMASYTWFGLWLLAAPRGM